MASFMSSQLLDTPIGTLILTASAIQLQSIRIANDLSDVPTEPHHYPDDTDSDRREPLLIEAVAQLRAWFEGRLKEFDLPLVPLPSARGQILRQAISDILYGNTMSYGEVARRASSGPRAIGQACRRNAFPIIIPCHRVVGANQSIGHYSGGDGVATKKWLIAHEQRF